MKAGNLPVINEAAVANSTLLIARPSSQSGSVTPGIFRLRTSFTFMLMSTRGPLNVGGPRLGIFISRLKVRLVR